MAPKNKRVVPTDRDDSQKCEAMNRLRNYERRRRRANRPTKPAPANAIVEGSGTATTVKLSTRSVPLVPTVPPLIDVVFKSTSSKVIVLALSKAPPPAKSKLDG